MKILYYDCFAGISGDMNLAAMIGLGVPPKHLQTELSKLGLDHEFELRVSADSRHGIHGTRVDVVLTGPAAACARGHGPAFPAMSMEQAHSHVHGPHHGQPAHGHDHDHSHDHNHVHAHGPHHHEPAPDHGHGLKHGHGHGHGQTHDHDHANGHKHAPDQGHGHDNHSPSALTGHSPQAGDHHHAPHRNLAAIEALILGSALAEPVKKTSLAIFRKLAEAEAKVHGKPVDEVHFHEVGATDALVDIVGAAICRHFLGVDAVWASPVELGGGFVRCAHGLIPVPAPATVELLTGLPTTRGAVPAETTTPTGAAILATLADAFTATPALTTEATAYGIGHRDTAIPNVLRVHLARPAASQGVGTVQQARLLQCNIDDMTAEMLGVAMDVLMDSGAMDVHFTPILMKKNRPATCLSLLCAAADEERFKELLFRHTTTLGIKSFALDKTVLDIAFERLDTPLGTVTLKHALRDGKVMRSKPELEDCRELAKRHGIPLADVYACIARHGKEPS